jgi:hypothetical protein
MKGQKTSGKEQRRIEESVVQIGLRQTTRDQRSGRLEARCDEIAVDI